MDEEVLVRQLECDVSAEKASIEKMQCKQEPRDPRDHQSPAQFDEKEFR